MILQESLAFRTLLTISRQRPCYDGPGCQTVLTLFATADHLRGGIRKRLEELDLNELPFAVLVTLRALDPEPVLPTTLASHANSSRAAMTSILDKLLERGLILREKSETDRRNYLITLTPEGQTLADRAEALVLDCCSRFGGRLSPADRRLALQLCKQLNNDGL